MDTASLIAVLSTGLSAGLSVMLMRLLLQQRQRSEARVLALATLASQPAAPAAYAATHALDAPLLKLRPKPRAAAAPPQRRAPAPIEPAEPVLDREPTIFREAYDVSVPQELFEGPARTRNPLLYVGVSAVLMAALIAFSFRWAASTLTAPTDETTATVAAPVVDPALALVSLSHARQGDGTLVISGVVRNPTSAGARERISAAVSVLDADGTLVASARAPLDFTTLAPGDESPFVVRIDDARQVARYRVSFRDADDATVAHVDRR